MRRRLLVAVAGLAVVLAAVVGLAAVAALSAAGDLQQAQRRLAAVRETGTTAQEVSDALRQASEDVDSAQRSLDGWAVDVVAAVPLLGRSWVAERAVARTSGAVVAGAVVLSDGLPGVQSSAGGVDLSALATVRSSLHGPAVRSRDALDELEQVPVSLTPPQVSRGVEDARSALSPAVQTLLQAERGLDVVGDLLGGDGERSLLVMLQNNAELRGTGGYAASFATGRLVDGRIALDPLQDVIDVADPPERARRVPAPEEYLEDYGGVAGNSTMWRSWNFSPNVPDSASVAAHVAGALLPRQPDVVVLLDVPAMGALAGLGGEGVSLPDGSVVTPDELTDALLVDAYADAGEGLGAQIRRREQLQAAATSAVTRLLAGGVPAPEAARTVGRLAAARHLSVWSARPAEQAALVDLGLAGAVQAPPGGDLAHVSVNNIGSNKLDYYVERELEVAVEVDQDRATVVQRVTFRNAAPPDLVAYVAGYERPGLLVSRVELSLAPEADVVAATVDGAPLQGTSTTGGGRQRLATRLVVPRGATSVVEVRYVLPLIDGRYELRLVPQPLVEDAGLRLSVRAAAGERLGTVTGAQLEAGAVEATSPLSEVRDHVVQLHRDVPGRWERLEDWWNSPVQLG